MKTTQILLVAALFLSVIDAQVFKGESPRASFEVQSSPDGNDWKGRSQVGVGLGFSVFGIAYLYTIIQIFIDINKRGKSYEKDIDDDMSQIKTLGLMPRMAEFDAELAIRLSGAAVDNTGDDQLIGEAMKLTQAQY